MIRNNKKEKAFTLLELLTAIVIIGILSTIGIVTFINIRKSQAAKFDQTQRELFKQTAKTYFSDHKSKLPTNPNGTSVVYLADLINENYLDAFLDYDKKNYDVKSSVMITKIAVNQYVYDVKLYPDGSGEEIPDNSSDNSTEFDFGKWAKQSRKEIVSDSDKEKNIDLYYSNESAEFNLTLNDEDGIVAFCYIIYKNGIKIYTSEYILGSSNKKMQDTIKLDTTNRGDGTYQIEVVVYDTKDHVKSGKSHEIMIDRVPPTCDTTKSTTKEWTNKSVEITGKCNDQEGKKQGNSGCKNPDVSREVKKEGPNNESPGNVKDKAGNKTVCEKVSVNIDKTPPKCGTINVSGTVGTNGWYRSNVTISKSDGSDALSGHASTKVNKKSITSETKGTVVTLTTADKAGNTCTETQTIKIDKTPPKCGTIKISGTVGDNGWYTSDVTISKSNGSDTISGHASTTVDIPSITSDTKGTVVTLTTADQAGNTCTKKQTVKVDKTAPTCGAIKISGTVGDNSWYTSNVTISKSNGSDTISGHASTIVDTSAIKSNTAGKTVTLTTKDKAGNTCTAKQTVKVDKTAPTISDFSITSKNNDYHTKSASVSATISEKISNKITYYIKVGTTTKQNNTINNNPNLPNFIDKTVTVRKEYQKYNGKNNNSTHTIQLCAKDLAGNEKCTKEKKYKVYERCTKYVERQNAPYGLVTTTYPDQYLGGKSCITATTKLITTGPGLQDGIVGYVGNTSYSVNVHWPYNAGRVGNGDCPDDTTAHWIYTPDSSGRLWTNLNQNWNYNRPDSQWMCNFNFTDERNPKHSVGDIIKTISGKKYMVIDDSNPDFWKSCSNSVYYK